MEGFALTGGDRVYLWLANATYTWHNVEFHPERIRSSESSMRRIDLPEGDSWHIESWDTRTGRVTQSEQRKAVGYLDLTIKSIERDIAVKVLPLDSL